MLSLIDPNNVRVPCIFLDGGARIPSNPAVTAALAAILNGGPCARRLMGGWFAAEGGFPAYSRLGRQRGHVTVRIGSPAGSEASAADPEEYWRVVEGLSALTLDTALVVLAQLCDPRFGDKTFHPIRRPIGINANSILKYKGYRRWGREREEFRLRIAEEISRLLRLRIDVDEFPGWDPEIGHWNPRGVSLAGDRFFELMNPGIRKTREPGPKENWPIRLGRWTQWWMNTQGKVWATELPAALVELDHRPNRAAQVLAKKIGLNSTLLLATARGRPCIVRRIDRLLEDVGELPSFEYRHDHWAGRLRDRFEDAMLILVESGVIGAVSWPETALPGDPERHKGWVDRWLAAKIEILRAESRTVVRPKHSLSLASAGGRHVTCAEGRFDRKAGDLLSPSSEPVKAQAGARRI